MRFFVSANFADGRILWLVFARKSTFQYYQDFSHLLNIDDHEPREVHAVYFIATEECEHKPDGPPSISAAYSTFHCTSFPW